MSTRLERECALVGQRARSLKIGSFGWSVEGDVVTLVGEALTPDAIDSALKLFHTTSAREVRNRMRHAPPDPERPGALHAGRGYVTVQELGPDAARLAESWLWVVRAGETLETIAEQVYGDRSRASLLACANRACLGPGRHVRPGQRLRVPQP